MKRNKQNFLFVWAVSVFVILISGCNQTPIPKPYGYFRVDLPKPTYEMYDNASLPYRFEKSTASSVIVHTKPAEKYWIDITYPKLNANIYGSYSAVNGKLVDLTEESRRIVYKHTVKADAISERPFENPEKKVYGIFYDLEGNTASPAQFVLTDSAKHFFRGALYFENVPNKDSIAPMENFIKQDIIHLIETFEWKGAGQK